MPDQSTANNTSGEVLSTTPEIKTFEFDSDGLGNVKNSVNLYRGTVNLPFNLVSLPGRDSLDVNITASYASNVQAMLNNPNTTSPTGIFGLGWEMPFDKIIVNKNNAGSTLSDTYYLAANGSATQLVQTGVTSDGALSFQMEGFQFWDVWYYQQQEKWVLRHEDGSSYIYGDKTSGRNTLQYGVKWGNWVGSSSVPSGQSQYVLSWNLSEIQSAWGSSVEYTYLNVTQNVGSNKAVFYTQASYIDNIKDSYGRLIKFNYGEKYGPANAGPGGIIEYQPQNYAQPSPNAYQDRYETKYMDFIEIYNDNGIFMLSINFDYDFINNSATSNPNYNILWKRCLTAMRQQNSLGESLPGMIFEYNKTGDKTAGSVKTITYPQGAAAKFHYSSQVLTTSRDLKINNPLPGSTPRVWFGEDYVVFTWYNSTSKTMRISVYSWSGSWTNYTITPDLSKLDIDPDSLIVEARDDFFALHFRNTASNRDEIYLYRRDMNIFGKWNLSKGNPIYLYLKTGAGSSVITVGDTFVIAYNAGYTNTPFNGYSWNWKSQSWTTPTLPKVSDVTGATNIAVAAFGNYYIVCFYTSSTQSAKFQIFYHDTKNVWNFSNSWTKTGIVIYEPATPGDFYFNFSLQESMALATYVTSSSSTAMNYSIMAIQWNETFQPLSPSDPLIQNYTSPIVDQKPLFNAFNTILQQSFVSNNGSLLVYLGGDPNSNNKQNWLSKSFDTSDTSADYKFISGVNSAIMSKSANSVVTNQIINFNPNIPGAAGWSQPTTVGSTGHYPTMLGDYYTIGKDIYYRGTKGAWQKLSTGLTYMTSEQSVQNRAPNYIIYQDNDTATSKAYIVLLDNGNAAPPKLLPNGAQKVYVQQDSPKPGTMLAGSDCFITYPASQSFDTASTLYLYKAADNDITGPITTYPVDYLEIDDGYSIDTPYYQSYVYESSQMSQIMYNSETGLAQYPQVTVVPGVKDPSTKPNGKTVNFFSNAISPQPQVSYPTGWIYNYYNITNGLLLGQQTYDSNNNQVASQTKYWQIYTTGPDLNSLLYGAYTRLIKDVNITNTVQQITEYTYDMTKGVQTQSKQSYVDSSGVKKYLVEDTVYGWQVPEYKDAMLAKHLYQAVAQKITTVKSDGAPDLITASSSSTWKNWADSGSDDWKWAPFQNFLWNGPGNSQPVFNYASPDSNPGWIKSSEILSRVMPAGNEKEIADVNGVVTSQLFDEEARFNIAQFTNASLDNDEASYYGFEDYEDIQQWAIGTGAYIIPDVNDNVIDAHTGTRSLKILPSPGGAAAMQRLLTPGNQSAPYIFSSWVKTDAAFDPANGGAYWKITLLQGSSPVGNPVMLNIDNTAGQWVYIYQVITLPSDAHSNPVTIKIEAYNTNSASYVLADDIRFCPYAAAFTARVVEPSYWNSTAEMNSNGEVNRFVYDSFRRVSVTTAITGDVNMVSSWYYSRAGNSNTFNETDPNASINVVPQGGSVLNEFMNGDQWELSWQAGAGDTWKAENGYLSLQAFSGKATLTFKDSDYKNNYGIFMNVYPSGVLTAPLGINLINGYSIQWDAVSCEWQFLNGSGAKIMDLPDTKLFVLSEDYTTVLNSGKVTRDLQQQFNLSNYVLSLSAGITTPTADKWIIQDTENNIVYYLLNKSDGIYVYKFSTEWLLLLADKTIMFYAGGRRIFSYIADNELSCTPEFFTENYVKINNIAAFGNPQAGVKFTNAAGSLIQVQSQLQEQMAVSQTIYDNLGRNAIISRPAYVAGGNSYPLFNYIPGFAVLDWNTFLMSGIVADAYPDDEGYPYTRSAYETSPLQRITETGLPGKDFTVGAHSTKYSYSPNDGSDGLPAGEFFQLTTVDPDGNTAYKITDKINNEIYNVAVAASGNLKNYIQYSSFINPETLHSPNYFNPPGTSSDNEWITSLEYDYSGRLVYSHSTDAQGTNFIYDTGGQLRFVQDAEGAKNGYYAYSKYDVMGRITETGYYTGAWDQATLQAQANDSPLWPSPPDTWRRRFYYDGDGTKPNMIGRLVESHTNNGDGSSYITETFTYDAAGNVLSETISFDNTSGESFVTSYSYNGGGMIEQISYPSGGGTVYYTYDQLGRQVGVGKSASDPYYYAQYTYNPDSTIYSETLNNSGAEPVQRNYGYNSPGWISEMADAKGNTALINNSFQYNVDETTGFFDGNLYKNSLTFNYPGSPQNYSYNYSYDNVRNLLSAKNTPYTDWSAGYTDPITYDSNGNMLVVERGAQQYKYIYEAGSNRLSSIELLPSASPVVQLVNNLDGNAESITVNTTALPASKSLKIVYDPFAQLTKEIDVAETGDSLSFAYDSKGTRAVKTVSNGGATRYSKSYIRSIDSKVLAEKITSPGNADEYVYYIYSSIGLIAMNKSNKEYFMLRDNLGSIRLVLDSSSLIAAGYGYLPYGGFAYAEETEEDLITYLYTGQEYDYETGLYNYNARMYSPDIGRFHQVDPAAQYYSPYIFNSNNPVNYIDPSGQFGFLALLGYIGLSVLQIGADVVTEGALTPEVVELEEIETEALITAETEETAVTLTESVEASEEVTTTTSEVSASTETTAESTSGSAIKAPEVNEDDFVGYHYTSSEYEESLSKGLKDMSGENFGGEAQLGEGFYTTKDEAVGEWFGDNVVNSKGGTRIRFKVYAKDFNKMSGSEVPEKLQWGKLPWEKDPIRSPYIKNYDYLKGKISGLPGNQIKLNPKTYPYTVLKRGYCTMPKYTNFSAQKMIPTFFKVVKFFK